MADKWKRREQKQRKKKNQMPVHGRGLLTVIAPVIEKKINKARKKRKNK